jgi:hypothetical protein
MEGADNTDHNTGQKASGQVEWKLWLQHSGSPVNTALLKSLGKECRQTRIFIFYVHRGHETMWELFEPCINAKIKNIKIFIS